VQSVSAVLVSNNVELPIGQSVQVLLPIESVYDPVAQAVQGPPSVPLYPRLHLQAADVLLPVPETEPVGQV